MKGLCHRCEYRAQFHETGGGPRYECQQPEDAVMSCYMYRPVRPVILKPAEGDTRPQFGPCMVSARSEYVGIADFELTAYEYEDAAILCWVPEEVIEGECLHEGASDTVD